jgi:hypothetical protein
MTSTVLPTTRVNVFESPLGDPKPPPLENGDRLSLREFMRRYEAMPEGIRAELIGGIVYMSAAVRVAQHGRPYIWLSNIVSTYAMATGLDCAGDSTIQLDQENAPQPDLLMYLPQALGSRAKLTDKGYLEGPPDFIAEVSASTVSIDLHDKLRAYEASGVREYVVWRVRDAAVDWFVLQEGKFLPLAADESGIYRSRTFPGLWLNVSSLLAREAQALWATLDAGMATAEYASFAALVKSADKPQQ